jgi:site-specific recombinase XerD
MEIQDMFLNMAEPVAMPESKRRRGRPCGAQTPVVADGQLGNHHFAFLRAMAEGIDPSECAERYLVGHERVDPRTARVMQRQLLERVVAVAKALNDIGLREASEQLEAAEAANTTSSSKLPSLGEFADTLDSDMCSESELIELYQERYGDAGQVSDIGYKTKIKALNYLQGRLAKTPNGDDSLAQWLPARLCAPLQRYGVLSLNNLITFINRSGRTWYRLIPRLGRERAARLMSWLDQIQPDCQEKLLKHTTEAQATQSKVLTEIGSGRNLAITALAPLEQLYVPEKLNGSDGAFRAHQTNTLGANTDLQAIEAWLRLLASSAKPTQIAYKREIERFYLWALLECRKALSSLDAVDCESYKAFLQRPPAHWVCALPYPRTHVLWRPFRGDLTATSAQRSLAAVSRLFADLVSAQYLRANPMPRMGGSRSNKVRLDVMRSFTIEDQVHIANTLKTLPDTASGRRTRAFVMLLMSAGLRASETQTTHASMIRVRNQEHVSDNMGLQVLGKGNKERIVPLRIELIHALNQHKADLSKVCSTPAEQLPLIGTLVKAPCRSAEKSSMPGSMLSTAGMYSVLKAFFANVAKQHAVHADFEKASAHWMRHTFAHQVLAATNNDLAVVQQLLGHSTIQTTAIYVKADMESRTKAINAMALPIFN